MLFSRVRDKYDLLIPGLIVAVFHIIDSKQRYRQAGCGRLAAALGERDGTLI